MLPSGWTATEAPTTRTASRNWAIRRSVAFVGGAYDGHYVYFASKGGGVAYRHDAGIALSGGWQRFESSIITAANGAVFDGRAVNYVPGSADSRGFRFDTNTFSFTTAAAWTQQASSPNGAFFGAALRGAFFAIAFSLTKGP